MAASDRSEAARSVCDESTGNCLERALDAAWLASSSRGSRRSLLLAARACGVALELGMKGLPSSLPGLVVDVSDLAGHVPKLASAAASFGPTRLGLTCRDVCLAVPAVIKRIRSLRLASVAGVTEAVRKTAAVVGPVLACCRAHADDDSSCPANPSEGILGPVAQSWELLRRDLVQSSLRGACAALRRDAAGPGTHGSPPVWSSLLAAAPSTTDARDIALVGGALVGALCSDTSSARAGSSAARHPRSMSLQAQRCVSGLAHASRSAASDEVAVSILTSALDGMADAAAIQGVPADGLADLSGALAADCGATDGGRAGGRPSDTDTCAAADQRASAMASGLALRALGSPGEEIWVRAVREFASAARRSHWDRTAADASGGVAAPGSSSLPERRVAGGGDSGEPCLAPSDVALLGVAVAAMDSQDQGLVHPASPTPMAAPTVAGAPTTTCVGPDVTVQRLGPLLLLRVLPTGVLASAGGLDVARKLVPLLLRRGSHTAGPRPVRVLAVEELGRAAGLVRCASWLTAALEQSSASAHTPHHGGAPVLLQAGPCTARVELPKGWQQPEQLQLKLALAVGTVVACRTTDTTATEADGPAAEVCVRLVAASLAALGDEPCLAKEAFSRESLLSPLVEACAGLVAALPPSSRTQTLRSLGHSGGQALLALFARLSHVAAEPLGMPKQDALVILTLATRVAGGESGRGGARSDATMCLLCWVFALCLRRHGPEATIPALPGDCQGAAAAAMDWARRVLTRCPAEHLTAAAAQLASASHGLCPLHVSPLHSALALRHSMSMHA